MNPPTLREAEALFAAEQAVEPFLDKVEVVVCPPVVWLGALAGRPRVTRLGAQNVDKHETGPFTGETGLAMLTDLQVEYVILGHSERRRSFGETDDLVTRKAAAALSVGLIPVVCVGSEALAEGEAEKIRLREQLAALLANVPKEQTARLVVAYEPAWAISTSGLGRIATPAYAEEMISFIRRLLAPAASVIYGGSVDETNAASFTARPGISGVLPGAASLRPAAFQRIVKAVAEQGRL